MDGEQPIDRQTLELEVPALQQLLCESDNSHVRKVAAIALLSKKEESLTRELLAIAKQPAMPSIRKAILVAMHVSPCKKVVPILLSVACESDLEIAATAIQQLEKIDESLRGKILFKLLKQNETYKSISSSSSKGSGSRAGFKMGAWFVPAQPRTCTVAGESAGSSVSFVSFFFSLAKDQTVS